MNVNVNVALMHRKEQAELSEALSAVFDKLDEFNRLDLENRLLRKQIEGLGHVPVSYGG